MREDCQKTPLDIHLACPMSIALAVVGGKWKGLILYHLHDGTKRFNQLMRLMPSITQRMLTRQLRELEAHGVIERRIYPQIPPKVEYSLSELGQTVIPVIQQLSSWGRQYRESSAFGEAFVWMDQTELVD
ncbi:MAG: helix-turn-helix domain-containing protein [Pseudomonadota bacterium]|nr:helix-turn-helix domain-containing protein [Pseudomonadota bacterium]